MQKIAAVVLFLLLLGTGVFFLFFWGDDAAPLAPGPGSGPMLEQRDVAHDAVDVQKNAGTVPGAAQRTAVAIAAPDLLDDPEIQAGLCGFRGRVVTHAQVPVADCGVRFYRAAMDVVLDERTDVFADLPSVAPNYVAGEIQTAADGTFLLTGVWPRAIYIMFAGIGTDAPMHQVVTRTPSPGEIVDLGDIELPDAGVITGQVYDDDGEPLAGALVRAADLPGTVVGFFPIERFDPEGALLIREPQAPVDVVEMPPWVKAAWEHVPIPTTYTDREGNFRLVGVVPGSNMLAVTAENHLSDLKPSVQVRAGEEKNVGKIRLRAGEELVGKVIDSAGKPVAGAEVLAGSTITMAPVDLARRLPPTDAAGKFGGLGFAPGKVTVAARRGPGHAWVIAEPQPLLSDVVVTLPATFAVTATISDQAGEAIAAPRLQLLRGKKGDGAAEMAVFGFVPPVALKERIERTAEGAWRISNLKAGTYTLVADAPGYATASTGFTVEAADASVALQLVPKVEFVVRVIDSENKPIRNAAIFAEVSGPSLFDMPINCGRTKADGTLTIDRFQAEKLRVSADHPKWGYAHGEATLQQELVLQMLPPGALEGVLTENGAPPPAGKYTVIVEWRRNDGPRGPLEQVPTMVTAGVDGRFGVAALQPGQYRLQTIDSLESMRSPGGMMGMFMSARMVGGGSQGRENVEVVSGQTAQVQLETGEKPIEGPTAHLFGSVMVDGQLAEGYQVMGWIERRRYNAEVDRAGRFDFGIVPAGNAQVTVSAAGGMFGMNETVWSGAVKLEEAEEKELRIEVMTSSMSGMVVTPDGSVASGAFIQAQGALKSDRGSVYRHVQVAADGSFSIDKVPEGKWTLSVQSGGDDRLRGKLEGIEVTAGMPVTMLRLELNPAIAVSGHVDVAMFGATKPEWAWIAIHELKPDGAVGNQVTGLGLDTDSGKFRTNELGVGRYAVRLHVGWNDKNERYRCQDLEVPAQGLAGIVLRGTRE